MTHSGQGESCFTGRPVFATTHWSVVLQTGDGQSPECLAALEKLCRTYWFPLFAFIRRNGYAEEDAKDLTQQFFARLLARRDFQTVDARKGKFRTFLLAALTHFLANERDRAQAAKRGGGRTILSFDEMNAEEFRRYEPASDISPDKLFDRRWAMTLLAQAVNHLQKEMGAVGKLEQFERLKGFLTNDAADGEYAQVAGQLKCAGQTVGVLVHRLRQRYRELVRAEVAHTVSSPTEVDEEMRHLLAALQN